MEDKELREEIRNLQDEITKLANLVQAGFHNLESNIQKAVMSKDWVSYTREQNQRCRCDITTIQYVNDQIDALIKERRDRQWRKVLKK